MGGKIEEIFNECGAILKGHFVLAEMGHSGTYLQKAILYRNPVIFENLCRIMAHEVSSKFTSIEAVVGPAPIGSVLAQRVAFYLGETYQKMVVPLFTEKDGAGEHLLRRGFNKDLVGKNVLVVDDVMTSGTSILQIIKAVLASKGQMVAAAVICDRGEVALNNLFQMFPVMSLSRLKPRIWTENDCSLCKEKIPIDADVGRGWEFLKSHPGYPSNK
ncbi:MAG: phosphoribosyltransferase family protein [Patescibacteria group bacterium]